MSAFYVNYTSLFKKERIVGRKNNTIYNQTMYLHYRHLIKTEIN